jgi:hypothetical protein
MGAFRARPFFVCFLCLFVTLYVVPVHAVARPPRSGVEMVTEEDGGGTGNATIVDAAALEGADLAEALSWATWNEEFVKAGMELTAGRDLIQDGRGAVAFSGKYGPDGKEIRVVIVPFPHEKRPEEKAGFVAVARSGDKTRASYCVIERAVAPTEPGAISMDVPVEGAPGEKAWLWTPEETIGSGGSSTVRKYFKCVTRGAVIGCSLCVARCVVSVLFFMECMKLCCGTALIIAVISCAIEMMAD